MALIVGKQRKTVPVGVGPVGVENTHLLIHLAYNMHSENNRITSDSGNCVDAPKKKQPQNKTHSGRDDKPEQTLFVKAI